MTLIQHLKSSYQLSCRSHKHDGAPVRSHSGRGEGWREGGGRVSAGQHDAHLDTCWRKRINCNCHCITDGILELALYSSMQVHSQTQNIRDSKEFSFRPWAASVPLLLPRGRRGVWFGLSSLPETLWSSFQPELHHRGSEEAASSQRPSGDQAASKTCCCATSSDNVQQSSGNIACFSKNDKHYNYMFHDIE